jgi:hypothetical protein
VIEKIMQNTVSFIGKECFMSIAYNGVHYRRWGI